MTEWKPYMNPMAGEKKYSLYKTINPDKPDHSGNRLNYGAWYKTRKEAEEKYFKKFLQELEQKEDR